MTTVSAPVNSGIPAVMSSSDRIAPEQPERLKRLRLRALKDSPACFLSERVTEQQYPDERWAAEFERGDWYAGVIGRHDVSLIGVTREPDMPESERYIEYMWVAERFRQRGIGRYMLQDLLEVLRVSGVKVVYLWVLDGNVAAAQLYKKVGFDFTGVVQPLAARPGRSEQQMMIALA